MTTILFPNTWEFKKDMWEKTVCGIELYVGKNKAGQWWFNGFVPGKRVLKGGPFKSREQAEKRAEIAAERFARRPRK